MMHIIASSFEVSDNLYEGAMAEYRQDLLQDCILIYLQIPMGNEQPKKLSKATKGQIDIACLKAKLHLELYRDRKNNEIIKGEKELVAKLRGKSRNKVEEILIAERVVNGLKYAQACNLLVSCATSLRGHALFLADNQDKADKIEPWLPFIYSLIYGADHLGLSSLNEFKSVMKALNDPQAVPKYTNPEILQLLAASPTPEELNVYMVEMSERNGIPLQEINMIGHKFTTDYHPPPTPEQIAIEKQLAEQMKKQFENNWGGQGQGGQGGKQSFNEGNQGFNGGFNGQGGQGFSGQGVQGGQGLHGQGGFNGGFNGGINGQGGFNGGGYNPYSNEQPINNTNNNLNPYSSIRAPSPASEINVGPSFHMAGTAKQEAVKPKPREFTSYQDIIGIPQDPNKGPVYPSIDPNQFKMPKYAPQPPQAGGKITNPFQSKCIVDVNNKGEVNNSPTISQILRDLK